MKVVAESLRPISTPSSGSSPNLVGNLPEAAFAHSFGEATPEPVGGRVIRYLEASRIAADPVARVIFFKTGLGTGWDCPRAEVLFSFRRSVDSTTVAQTIGRMVRSPLARRIVEDDALNAGYLFLPHYNERAVGAVVRNLAESGNTAVADTIVARRETIILPRRAGAEPLIQALGSVPTYLVPAPRRRDAIRVLSDLANFLSRTGLDPDAHRRETADAARLLVERRDALTGDASFARAIDEEAEIRVRRAEVTPGETALAPGAERTLAATEESVARLFADAGRRLTNEVASTYVRLRLAADPGAITVARLEAAALSELEGVLDDLAGHAGARIDALRREQGPAVAALSAARQARYRAILRQAPDPTEEPLVLPEEALVERGEQPLSRHLYAEADGLAPIALNTWERAALGVALADQATLGWYRNPERDGGSLCVPWREGNTWRPMYPDLLVVRADEGRLVVDVLDPHDHTRADAIGKAKGLSGYAARHAEVLGHVDLIAEIDGRLRRLHLEQGAIRAQVDALGDAPAELRNLYLREG